MQIESTCMFCGVGCRLVYNVEGSKITSILPDPSDPASKGKPCVKGLSINTIKAERVTTPLVRSSSGMDRVDWKYALDYIKDKLSTTNPEDTGWIGSGEITNEDNYAIAKFARMFGSENIDSCARLCHAPTVDGFKSILGVGCSPGRMDDIYGLDTLLLVGTNPIVTYPALGARIVEAKQRGLHLLDIAPWHDETTSISNHLAIMRMDLAVFFLLSIVDYLIKRGLSSDIQGFEKLKESARRAREIYESIGDLEKVKEFGDVILGSERFGIAHGMGITQTYNGTATVKAIASLALLKQGVIVTNRGKVNIQGAGDVGVYPGKGGKTLIDFLLLEPADFVFTSIFNPAVSMPDLKATRRNLGRMFLVQAIPYLNTTSEYADVILPTPLLIEREGTVTTGENRVRPVRKVLTGPKNAKQEWQILTELGKEIGIDLNFRRVVDVTYEIKRTIPRYGNLRVSSFYGETWWDQFVELDMRKRFVEIKPEVKTFKRRYILLTARRMPQFNTGDLTTKSERLNTMYSSRAVYISEKDALREGLRDGDSVRLISDAGELTAELRVGYGKIPEGILVGVFHFEDFPVNMLTPRIFDPETNIPSYKVVPVDIKKTKKD